MGTRWVQNIGELGWQFTVIVSGEPRSVLNDAANANSCLGSSLQFVVHSLQFAKPHSQWMTCPHQVTSKNTCIAHFLMTILSFQHLQGTRRIRDNCTSSLDKPVKTRRVRRGYALTNNHKMAIAFNNKQPKPLMVCEDPAYSRDEHTCWTRENLQWV